MNLVLIGYRGTGKSVVGKRLADDLGRPFYDTDRLVEEAAQRTIAQMVETQGWPFFRAREREVIEAVSARSGCIIAPGGGAVMDPTNVERLGKNGVFVLLTARANVLARRILGDRGSEENRPPLLNGDLYQEIETLLEKRMPTYRALAQFLVDTSDLTVDEVVTSVKASIASAPGWTDPDEKEG